MLRIDPETLPETLPEKARPDPLDEAILDLMEPDADAKFRLDRVAMALRRPPAAVAAALKRLQARGAVAPGRDTQGPLYVFVTRR